MKMMGADARPEFVYDRTKEDVDRVAYLHQKGWRNLSAEERGQWLSGTMKGALNLSDLRRIRGNIHLIALMMELPVETDIDGPPYIPDGAYFQRMLEDVGMLRGTGFIYQDTPLVPGQPVNTYQKVNAIERILHDVYTVYADNRADAYYCGQELYAGSLGLI